MLTRRTQAGDTAGAAAAWAQAVGAVKSAARLAGTARAHGAELGLERAARRRRSGRCRRPIAARAGPSISSAKRRGEGGRFREALSRRQTARRGRSEEPEGAQSFIRLSLLTATREGSARTASPTALHGEYPVDAEVSVTYALSLYRRGRASEAVAALARLEARTTQGAESRALLRHLLSRGGRDCAGRDVPRGRRGRGTVAGREGAAGCGKDPAALAPRADRPAREYGLNARKQRLRCVCVTGSSSPEGSCIAAPVLVRYRTPGRAFALESQVVAQLAQRHPQGEQRLDDPVLPAPAAVEIAISARPAKSRRRSDRRTRCTASRSRRKGR